MTSAIDESVALENANIAFQRVGKDYGYKTVSVEFCAFKDFKVQWTRSYRMAHFRISDYLNDAPEEVFEGLADTLFAKITAKDEVPYSRDMRDWVLAPEFSEKKRPIYLNRSRNVTGFTEGQERDLRDSVERLIDMGLVDRNVKFGLSWIKTGPGGKAASSSVLMRLITVADILDDAQLPDFVVDYAVYSQYLKITKGTEVFGFSTEVYTREEEKMFGKYREAERFLDKMSLYL